MDKRLELTLGANVQLELDRVDLKFVSLSLAFVVDDYTSLLAPPISVTADYLDSLLYKAFEDQIKSMARELVKERLGWSNVEVYLQLTTVIVVNKDAVGWE